MSISMDMDMVRSTFDYVMQIVEAVLVESIRFNVYVSVYLEIMVICAVGFDDDGDYLGNRNVFVFDCYVGFYDDSSSNSMSWSVRVNDDEVFFVILVIVIVIVVIVVTIIIDRIIFIISVDDILVLVVSLLVDVYVSTFTCKIDLNCTAAATTTSTITPCLIHQI